jgi:hypothetical protein
VLYLSQKYGKFRIGSRHLTLTMTGSIQLAKEHENLKELMSNSTTGYDFDQV